MRKWLLIGGTLAFLIAVFAAFMWSQRGVRVSVATDKPLPASRPSLSTQPGSIGRTESGWAMTHDKSTGLPQARFRGEQFIPQEGDQILVERPQVEFFVGKKREEVVSIVGRTGLVIIPGEGPRIRSDFKTTPTQAPSRGEMRDVTVRYYRSQEAAAANKPELTLTLNNAYFDSELYEIATEEYTNEQGVKIPGKQVPIVVRGEDFEFDGEGLHIRWDEHSQRLKSLTIHKGHQLVIKRPAREMRRPAGRASSSILPLQFATTDSKQVVQAAAAGKSLLDHLYRATFHDQVILTQKGNTLATAPQMHVDFVERSSRPDGTPTRPAAQRTTKTPAAAPKPQAGAQPAKSPSDPLGVDPEEPIVIRWGGPMTVTPAPDEALKPESENDAVIRFAGTPTEPVHMYGEGGEIVATSAAYQTEKGFAWVEGSEGQPVRLTDADGSVLLTPQLRYSQQDGKAILRGPSSALVKSQKDGREEQLKATWRDLAEASFTTEGSSRSLTSLALKGDVSVEHPQLRQFNAGVLRLDFDPTRERGKDASAQLKQISASEQVVCMIADDEQELQTIRAEKLAIQMAQRENGESYASRVEASGSVVAGTDAEQIQADSIQAELDPPGESAKEQQAFRGVELAGLQKLVAIGHVKVHSAEGETITADRLQVRQAKDRPSWILLEGAPAMVSQEQTLLAGPFIEIDTVTEKALTTGGGRLVVANTSSAVGTKGQPVEVTWSGDGIVDGARNIASLAGNVAVKYVDSDGSINEANSDRVDIELGVKQATKPKTEKAASTSKSKTYEFMADRYPRKLTLLPAAGKDVRLQSLLPGPGGTIARQMNLLGSRLDLVLDEQGGVQRMEVPAQQDHPGRLLYIELPVATRSPVKTGDPFKDGEFAGSTAFAWHEMLRYDKSSSQMTMTGGTMIRHEPQTPGAKKFMVDAARIVADVAEKTGSRSSSSGGSMDIRKLTLMGAPVHLVREDIDLTAPLIEIDPAKKTVLARGTQQGAVNVEKGRMVGGVEWVQINSETSEMKFGRAMAVGRQ